MCEFKSSLLLLVINSLLARVAICPRDQESGAGRGPNLDGAKNISQLAHSLFSIQAGAHGFSSIWTAKYMITIRGCYFGFYLGHGVGNGNNLCTLVVSNEMQMISVRLENVQDK